MYFYKSVNHIPKNPEKHRSPPFNIRKNARRHLIAHNIRDHAGF
jgi:hypothetical protein